MTENKNSRWPQLQDAAQDVVGAVTGIASMVDRTPLTDSPSLGERVSRIPSILATGAVETGRKTLGAAEAVGTTALGVTVGVGAVIYNAASRRKRS